MTIEENNSILINTKKPKTLLLFDNVDNFVLKDYTLTNGEYNYIGAHCKSQNYSSSDKFAVFFGNNQGSILATSKTSNSNFTYTYATIPEECVKVFISTEDNSWFEISSLNSTNYRARSVDRICYIYSNEADTSTSIAYHNTGNDTLTLYTETETKEIIDDFNFTSQTFMLEYDMPTNSTKALFVKTESLQNATSQFSQIFQRYKLLSDPVILRTNGEIITQQNDENNDDIEVKRIQNFLQSQESFENELVTHADRVEHPITLVVNFTDYDEEEVFLEEPNILLTFDTLEDLNVHIFTKTEQDGETTYNYLNTLTENNEYIGYNFGNNIGVLQIKRLSKEKQNCTIYMMKDFIYNKAFPLQIPNTEPKSRTGNSTEKVNELLEKIHTETAAIEKLQNDDKDFLDKNKLEIDSIEFGRINATISKYSYNLFTVKPGYALIFQTNNKANISFYSYNHNKYKYFYFGELNTNDFQPGVIVQFGSNRTGVCLIEGLPETELQFYVFKLPSNIKNTKGIREYSRNFQEENSQVFVPELIQTINEKRLDLLYKNLSDEEYFKIIADKAAIKHAVNQQSSLKDAVNVEEPETNSTDELNDTSLITEPAISSKPSIEEFIIDFNDKDSIPVLLEKSARNIFFPDLRDIEVTGFVVSPTEVKCIGLLNETNDNYGFRFGKEKKGGIVITRANNSQLKQTKFIAFNDDRAKCDFSLISNTIPDIFSSDDYTFPTLEPEETFCFLHITNGTAAVSETTNSTNSTSLDIHQESVYQSAFRGHHGSKMNIVDEYGKEYRVYPHEGFVNGTFYSHILFNINTTGQPGFRFNVSSETQPSPSKQYVASIVKSDPDGTISSSGIEIQPIEGYENEAHLIEAIRLQNTIKAIHNQTDSDSPKSEVPTHQKDSRSFATISYTPSEHIVLKVSKSHVYSTEDVNSVIFIPHIPEKADISAFTYDEEENNYTFLAKIKQTDGGVFFGNKKGVISINSKVPITLDAYLFTDESYTKQRLFSKLSPNKEWKPEDDKDYLDESIPRDELSDIENNIPNLKGELKSKQLAQFQKVNILFNENTKPYRDIYINKQFYTVFFPKIDGFNVSVYSKKLDDEFQPVAFLAPSSNKRGFHFGNNNGIIRVTRNESSNTDETVSFYLMKIDDCRNSFPIEKENFMAAHQDLLEEEIEAATNKLLKALNETTNEEEQEQEVPSSSIEEIDDENVSNETDSTFETIEEEDNITSTESEEESSTSYEEDNTTISEQEEESSIINEEEDNITSTEEEEESSLYIEEDNTTISEQEEESSLYIEEEDNITISEEESSVFNEEEDNITSTEQEEESSVFNEEEDNITISEQDEESSIYIEEEENATSSEQEEESSIYIEEEDNTTTTDQDEESSTSLEEDTDDSDDDDNDKKKKDKDTDDSDDDDNDKKKKDKDTDDSDDSDDDDLKKKHQNVIDSDNNNNNDQKNKFNPGIPKPNPQNNIVKYKSSNVPLILGFLGVIIVLGFIAFFVFKKRNPLSHGEDDAYLHTDQRDQFLMQNSADFISQNTEFNRDPSPIAPGEGFNEVDSSQNLEDDTPDVEAQKETTVKKQNDFDQFSPFEPVKEPAVQKQNDFDQFAPFETVKEPAVQEKPPQQQQFDFNLPAQQTPTPPQQPAAPSQPLENNNNNFDPFGGGNDFNFPDFGTDFKFPSEQNNDKLEGNLFPTVDDSKDNKDLDMDVEFPTF